MFCLTDVKIAIVQNYRKYLRVYKAMCTWDKYPNSAMRQVSC